MKKLLIALALLPMSASLTAIAAVDDADFARQLASQTEQLRPQHFSFYSDRYIQLKANASHKETFDVLSFKEQLDSQKDMIRHHKFSPASDAHYQVTSRQK